MSSKWKCWLIVGLVFLMFGCLEVTPDVSTLSTVNGRSLIFKATSDILDAEVVWTLDGERVSTDNFYVLEAVNTSDTTVSATLTVAEEGGSAARVHQHFTWTIEILPSGTCYLDEDSDTYGDPDKPMAFEGSAPQGCVLNNTDCDDRNPSVFQGAEELCDAIDNDCDSEVDEDIPAEAISCGVGPCAADGVRECHMGVWVEFCNSPPWWEECNGIDDDCDGQVDEDVPPETITCGEFGCMRTAQLTCVDGLMVGSCVPGEPAPEICDGIDNDCDGEIDEGVCPQITCGVGACMRNGQVLWVDGQRVDFCVPGDPTPEICDGIDNDCNGKVNDGYLYDVPQTVCGPPECGQFFCIGGQWVYCEPYTTCVPGFPL